MEGLRGVPASMQEPDRQEGLLLKRRKWPMKGWHKVSTSPALLAPHTVSAVRFHLFLQNNTTALVLSLIELRTFHSLLLLMQMVSEMEPRGSALRLSLLMLYFLLVMFLNSGAKQTFLC